jgi:filamentous hemagglutinin
MTLNGTLTLGNAAGTTSASLTFSTTGDLAGTGNVVMGASAGNVISITPANGVLTIDSGITISAGSGSISGASNDSIVNNGTILANQSGGGLSIIAGTSATLTNAGTITASNGATIGVDSGTGESGNLAASTFINTGTVQALSAGSVRIGGMVTSLGTLNTAGGFAYFDGTLNNTGDTLQIGNSVGTLLMEAGVINGGIVATSGTGTLGAFNDQGRTATLNGVTLAGTFVASTNPYGTTLINVTNGLNLSNGAINLSTASNILFSGSQAISGTGVITLAVNSAVLTESTGSTLTTTAA